jgi:hypothetical protein
MLPPKKRPLDQVRDRLRLKNYTYWTEKSYLYWIKQYILFHKAKQSFACHPNERIYDYLFNCLFRGRDHINSWRFFGLL